MIHITMIERFRIRVMGVSGADWLQGMNGRVDDGMKRFVGVLLSLFAAGIAAACVAPTPSTQPRVPSPDTTAGLVLPAGFDVEGHRGARGLKPENTLPAFETALDLGVDTLELDLHFTADDVVVIWHDDIVDASKCRLDPFIAEPAAPDPESASSFDLRIRRLTLAQLQEYRCDRNPDPEAFPAQKNTPTALARENYRIVSLAHLFDFVEQYATSAQKSDIQRRKARRVRFNVETKRKPDRSWAIGDDFDGEQPGAFERAIVDLVQERGIGERVMVQSFDYRSLWAIHQIAPAIRLVVLTTDPVELATLAEQGASALSPRSAMVTPSLLEQAHAAGLQVIPWTVDEPAAMRRLIEMGVDGLITDRPDLLVALVVE